MSLNERQAELVQFIQQKLQENQDVTEGLRDAAFALYCSLGEAERPPIKTSNPVAGALNDQGKEKYPTLSNYYHNRQPIEFLMDWTLKILPLLQILIGVGHLPVSRKTVDDFEGFINQKLDDYMAALQLLTDFSIISMDDIQVIERICDDLKEAVGTYLDGLPAAAFGKLISCMQHIEGRNFEPLAGAGTSRSQLFKMRLGSSNHMYSRDDMFHIPFQYRGLVKTNRYSIPGLPCVYLGSTPLTCWEEMGKPDLSSTHTSLYLPSDDLSYFDMSIPPAAMAEHVENEFKRYYGVDDLTELYGILRTFFIMWPLIACCSVRVLNGDHAFKPEYIIPQLLLQWIQQLSGYDGISYFSTKIDHYTLQNFPVYQNYAFPVKVRRDTGHCIQLKAKFTHITNAVPWQVFQLHKGGGGETSISERNTKLEFMPGIEMNYNISDFGRLETFLIYVMKAEINATN